MNTQTTSIKLGDRKAKLQHLADLKKRNVHSLLLEAVDDYLEAQTERLNYEKNAIASYQHYRETGLHITPAELRTWADSLGTDESKEMPECHL